MAVVLCVKFFIPLFTTINIIIYLSNEFTDKKAEGRKWPTGITWLGRMLWFIPIISAFCGLIPKFRPEIPSVYDLIEQQHGIRFNNAKFGDHSHNWDGKTRDDAAEGKGETEMAEKANIN